MTRYPSGRQQRGDSTYQNQYDDRGARNWRQSPDDDRAPGQQPNGSERGWPDRDQQDFAGSRNDYSRDDRGQEGRNEWDARDGGWGQSSSRASYDHHRGGSVGNGDGQSRGSQRGPGGVQDNWQGQGRGFGGGGFGGGGESRGDYGNQRGQYDSGRGRDWRSENDGGYGRQQGWAGNQSQGGQSDSWRGEGGPSGNYGSSGYNDQGSGAYGNSNYGGQRMSGGYGTSGYGGPGMWGGQGSESRGSQPGRSSQNRGPKGYQRSDDRLREDICERLMHNPHVDSSEVSVEVQNGKVTLQGCVCDRGMKHSIEDIVDQCMGVQDIDNRVTVSRETKDDRDDSSQSSSQSPSKKSGSTQGTSTPSGQPTPGSATPTRGH